MIDNNTQTLDLKHLELYKKNYTNQLKVNLFNIYFKRCIYFPRMDKLTILLNINSTTA